MTKLQMIVRSVLGAGLLLALSSEAFSRDISPVAPRAAIRRNNHINVHNQEQPKWISTTTTSQLNVASVAVPGELPVNNNDDGHEASISSKRTTKSFLLDMLLKRQRGGGAAKTTVTTKPKEGSFLKRHPFVSAVSITTINAVLADLLTQLVFEGNPWNPKRSLVFGAFGLLYQGMVQYAIVNLVWEKVFPGNKPKAVISKICGMNLLSDPLFFMPTFYIFKEVMATGNLGLSTIKAALMGYKANCFMDWRNSWMVWFPGHAVTYGVMPTHKRIPWMAFLSFFYMCVLSITRGGA